MQKDTNALEVMEQQAIALEKDGSLDQCRLLLQKVLVDRSDGSLLQTMTAGNLARVVTKIYRSRADLPKPGTSEYEDLNRFIQMIRTIVDSAESTRRITFEDLVDLEKFNRLIKDAADHKWDAVEHISRQLFVLQDQYPGCIRVGPDQIREDANRLKLHLEPVASFAADNANIVTAAQTLLEGGDRLTIIYGCERPKLYGL